MNKPKKAFTLIELLVVIAIIGILATISVLALSNARAKSRDAKRAGDMKQIQTALELFFNDNNRYPTAEEWNTGKIYSTSTGSTSTYMQIIPTAPTPADGTCSSGQNTVSYTPTSDGSSYSISFCLGNTTGTLTSGPKCLTPSGILNVDCSPVEPEALSPDFFVGTFSSYANTFMDFVQNNQNQYIVVGRSDLNGASASALKLHSDFSVDTTFADNGNLVLSGDPSAWFNDIEPTSNGGYVAVGTIEVSSQRQGYLVVFDENGQVLIDNNFGGTHNDVFESVTQAPDGGFIMAGQSNDGMGERGWALKTTANGLLDTSFGVNGQRYFGSNNWDVMKAVKKTYDNGIFDGYMLAGTVDNNNGAPYSGLLVKLNSDGTNDTSFGVNGELDIDGAGSDGLMDVVQSPDGGYLAVGYTNSYVPSYSNNQGWVVKIDSVGNLEWQTSGNPGKFFGDTGDSFFHSVENIQGGGYILGGSSSAYSGGTDGWLLKLDANGNSLWQTGALDGKYYDSGGVDYFFSAKQVSGGGYMMAGYDKSANSRIIKTDVNGNWQ